MHPEFESLKSSALRLAVLFAPREMVLALPLTEFLIFFPSRAALGLGRLGLHTLGDLLALTRDQLKGRKNFGRVSLAQVEVALLRLGLSLRDGAGPPLKNPVDSAQRLPDGFAASSLAATLEPEQRQGTSDQSHLDRPVRDADSSALAFELFQRGFDVHLTAVSDLERWRRQFGRESAEQRSTATTASATGGEDVPRGHGRRRDLP